MWMQATLSLSLIMWSSQRESNEISRWWGGIHIILHNLLPALISLRDRNHPMVTRSWKTQIQQKRFFSMPTQKMKWSVVVVSKRLFVTEVEKRKKEKKEGEEGGYRKVLVDAWIECMRLLYKTSCRAWSHASVSHFLLPVACWCCFSWSGFSLLFLPNILRAYISISPVHMSVTSVTS